MATPLTAAAPLYIGHMDQVMTLSLQSILVWKELQLVHKNWNTLCEACEVLYKWEERLVL